MNLKLTNFSTIIIVNKNQEQTQAIRVKTKHLKRMKHYLVSVICVILGLAGMVLYLSSKDTKHELEKKQLLAQIAQLKGQQPAAAVPTTVNKASSAADY